MQLLQRACSENENCGPEVQQARVPLEVVFCVLDLGLCRGRLTFSSRCIKFADGKYG